MPNREDLYEYKHSSSETVYDLRDRRCDTMLPYKNDTVLTTDKTPFLSRQTLNPTGFSGYVREKLIGASYAWNQLVENGNFASTSGWTAQRGTISASNNVLSYTVTEVGVADVQNRIERYINVIQGHKYLLSAQFKPAHDTKVGFMSNQWSGVTGETVSSSKFTLVQRIFNATSTTATLNMEWIWSCVNAGYSVGDVNQIKECQIIDLTLAFGSTIADYLYGLSNNGGITKLRDMGCPIDKYTAYGNYLVSSQTSGKKIVGKNLLDLTTPMLVANTATYSIDGDTVTYTATGAAYPRVVYDLTPFKKFNNGVLYFSAIASATGSNTYFRLQDAVTNTIIKNYAVSGSEQSVSGSFDLSGWESPALIMYINASQSGTVGQKLTITNFILCLNSLTDKTYEHYWETTYSLGNDELRGLFKLVNNEIVADGDVKESNGSITRTYGIVDLGSIDWDIVESASAYKDFRNISMANVIKPVDSQAIANGACEIFAMTSRNDQANNHPLNTIAITLNGYIRVIANASYTDATAFKTAMSGVQLVYEKATPTTEQSTPFADPMSMVGATTEEYIDDRTTPCPVGAERQYMGQSEDIIPIPSAPQSDGIWVQKCYVSGGKAQYVWELEE